MMIAAVMTAMRTAEAPIAAPAIHRLWIVVAGVPGFFVGFGVIVFPVEVGFILFCAGVEVMMFSEDEVVLGETVIH